MEPNFLGNFFGGGGRVVETWTFYFSLSYFTLLFLPIVKRLHIDVGLVHKILAQNGLNV
jgi:hypothetical protein